MAELTQTGGFGFSEAQEMYRRAVRDFAERELAPAAKQRNKKELASAEELKGIMKKLYDSGLFGMELPEKFGGHPSDWTTYGIAVEELTRVDFLSMHIYHLSRILVPDLMEAQEEVRGEWLLPMVKGEKLVCMALTEPGCGSDAAAMQTRAVKDGDYYVIADTSKWVIWWCEGEEMTTPVTITDIEVRWTGQASKKSIFVELFVKDSAAGFPVTAALSFTITESGTDTTRSFYLDATALAYVNSLPQRVVTLKVESSDSSFILSTDQILFIASP